MSIHIWYSEDMNLWRWTLSDGNGMESGSATTLHQTYKDLINLADVMALQPPQPVLQ